jgi:hypothetical protein
MAIVNSTKLLRRAYRQGNFMLRQRDGQEVGTEINERKVGNTVRLVQRQAEV